MHTTRRLGRLQCSAALVVLAAGSRPLPAQQSVRLTQGIVITHSVRIVPGTYRLKAPASLDSSVITIRGDNITVDFGGSALEGSPVDANSDGAQGVAIRVDGGHNVRIMNARVRGYKIGLLARRTRGLDLFDNQISYNWKPRLYSLVEHESLLDWLSHHNNEHDEWLRFGVAIYLSDVLGGSVRGNRIEQGMEGLMLVRTDSLRIWNNVIEFNSGVGIALYRSSYNRIMHNYASYNVRGFSQGFYRRGQDSADLLLYQQSSHNVVAFNSMTHGGDGLFLWAGQSTMDTGQGGCNDNLFYANDFSFAPTNAMEATFSRNLFIANRANGSEYGLWGGYSYDSKIIGNDFANNRTGIAIEHGQANEIRANRLVGDSTAIRLWAIPEEPSDWGYPKHRDTHSRDYDIARNVFAGNRVALRIAQTAHTTLTANEFIKVDSVLVNADTSNVTAIRNDTTRVHIRVDSRQWPPSAPAWRAPSGIALPKRLPGGLNPEAEPLAHRDRSAIIVDEWGPYDWRSPKLWPRDSSFATPLGLRVVGPRGNWRVIDRNGVAQLSKERGRIGDTIVVTPASGFENNWRISLEYRGGTTVSPRGVTRAAGMPYVFSYGRFNPIENWSVSFFALADSVAPRTPIATLQVPRLDYMWYRPTVPGVPQSNFRITATSDVKLAPGKYALRSISDDAVRVWVDDSLVIDNWKPHESELNVESIPPGEHRLRVEYYQLTGWTELRVEIVRDERSDS
jgi:parallel beta-helix repeat protein